MYAGFQVPGGYRRGRHHRRRHHHHHKTNGHKKEGEDDSNRPGTLSTRLELLSISNLVEVTPPAERVHFILGEDDQDGLHESHPLFSELEELVTTGDGTDLEWRERARFVFLCSS